MAAMDELTTKMTAHVIDQIETRLREAHLVSTNANNFVTQGP